jgi:hypothetical protein
MRHESNNEKSDRASPSKDLISHVSGMAIREKHNTTLILKCVPAILVPRDEGYCQPVDEQDLGHENLWGSSNDVIVALK